MRQLYTALSGYPAVLSCGTDPVGPVEWTCQHSGDSAVKDIGNDERFVLHDSCLVIYNVETDDSGTYNCTDAAGERHAVQLNVLGKPCLLFIFCVVSYGLYQMVHTYLTCA